MYPSSPKKVDELTEQYLGKQAEAIECLLDCDLLGLSSPLVSGVDNVIRSTVEVMKRRSCNNKLVVVLTTMGGYIEVVQRIAETFRHHYEIVDFIVPDFAFSAGTVLVMSGDAIHMNYYSRLGPIDPQVPDPDGSPVPALGYLIKWEGLLEKARMGTLTTVEAQVMVNFDQAKLYKYEQARELSITLLKNWLAQYKFKDWKVTETSKLSVDQDKRVARAKEVAEILNDTDRWHSHGTGIPMERLRNEVKLKIQDFDESAELANYIGVYYGIMSDYMRHYNCFSALHTKKGGYVLCL